MKGDLFIDASFAAASHKLADWSNFHQTRQDGTVCQNKGSSARISSNKSASTNATEPPHSRSALTSFLCTGSTTSRTFSWKPELMHSSSTAFANFFQVCRAAVKGPGTMQSAAPSPQRQEHNDQCDEQIAFWVSDSLPDSSI